MNAGSNCDLPSTEAKVAIDVRDAKCIVTRAHQCTARGQRIATCSSDAGVHAGATVAVSRIHCLLSITIGIILVQVR